MLKCGPLCSLSLKKKYLINPNEIECEQLKRLIAAGTVSTHKLTHARILLKADHSFEGGRTGGGEKVAEAVETS